MTRRHVAELVGDMHAWFESMRVARGYGGPVSHWWRHCRRYTGAGLDWRYEGIIHGYLNLYEATEESQWLDAAVTAGTDLIEGQLKSGNYRVSAFERNPEFGGTPHEACVSGALLRLARIRRDAEQEWQPFAQTARKNLQWHLDALWRSKNETFSDTVGLASYVPNKIASTVEAFLEWDQLVDGENLVDRLVEPATDTILELQVTTGPHRGAIHQMSAPESGNSGDGKFFPLYIARCIPPLLAVGEATGAKRFTKAAVQAGEFLTTVEHEDGGFPQVVYASGDLNTYPRWIAGLGDVLRAYDVLNTRGYSFETDAVETRLRAGYDECGAFRTAEGFGRLAGRTERQVFEDVLHVVGWNDKAFRWLTTQVDTVTGGDPSPIRTRCHFDGTAGRFIEDTDRIEFVPGGRAGRTYRWDKKSRWAEVR